MLQACPVDDRTLHESDPGVGGASFAGTGGDAGASDPGAGGTLGDAGNSAAAGSAAQGPDDAGGTGPNAGGSGATGGGSVGSGGSAQGGSAGRPDERCTGPDCSCDELPRDACSGDDCCKSDRVVGGTFSLASDPPTPATVEAFRLDTFEVTVGRFRSYVAQYVIPPGVDSGAHDAVIGSGWRPEWDFEMPNDRAEFAERLDCEGATWTRVPGEREAWPMNCVSWFEAFAFCAWDGGRLPTEAEWEYAASGGDEARPYPWGDVEPDRDHAVHGCDEDDPADCLGEDLKQVGSAADGVGRFGQLDLAGSVAEWTLDLFAPYPTSCHLCANVGDGTKRVARGGHVASASSFEVGTSDRQYFDPQTRSFSRGFRCARSR